MLYYIVFAPKAHNSSNVGSVTAGQARHNSSNVGGVTACQEGHNSCNNKYVYLQLHRVGLTYTVHKDIKYKAITCDAT